MEKTRLYKNTNPQRHFVRKKNKIPYYYYIKSRLFWHGNIIITTHGFRLTHTVGDHTRTMID